MRLELKSIYLENFKGVSSFSGKFNNGGNLLYGANATGKSSVLDAFFWCFFDTDSQNRTIFNITPLDKDGVAKLNLSTKVSLKVLINDNEYILEKERIEVYSKIINSNNKRLKGYTNNYKINSEPLSATEYKNYLTEFFGDLNILKSCLKIDFFNKDIPTDDKRALLMKLSKSDKSNDIINLYDKSDYIKVFLKEKKTFESEFKILNSKRIDLQKTIENTPIKLSELNSLKKQPLDNLQVVKWGDEFDAEKTKIEKDIKLKKEAIQKNEIKSLQLIEKIKKTQQELKIKKNANDVFKNEHYEIIKGIKEKIENLKLKDEFNKKQYNEDNSFKINELQRFKDQQMFKFEQKMFFLKKTEKELFNEIERLSNTRNGIEIAISEVKKYYYSKIKNDNICASCNQQIINQALTEEEKNELIESTNKKGTNLKNDLKANFESLEITNKLYNEKIDEITSAKKELNNFVKNITLKIDNEKENIINKKNYETPIELKEKINILLNQLADKQNKAELIIEENQKLINADTLILESLSLEKENFNKEQTEFDNEITKLENKIHFLKQDLEIKIKSNDTSMFNIEIDRKIQKYQAELKDTNNSLNDIFSKLDDLNNFRAFWFNEIEKRVNSLFDKVQFKLFEMKLNENIKNICECYYNGVPYNGTLNTGAKILADIEINSVLCKFYNFEKIPVFIDNMECLTNEIESKNQIIGLFASRDFQELTIK